MRYIFQVVLLFLLITGTAFSQSRVRTIDGKEYEGKILHDSSDYLLLRTKDDADVKIAHDQVAVVEYIAGSEKRVKASYPLLGISIGSPAGVQIMSGYYFKGFGIRASAGYIGRLYGGQINFMLNLKKHENFTSNLSLIAGYSHFDLGEQTDPFGFRIGEDIREWRYGGITWDANWSGFFLEAGLSAGSGDFHTPQIVFQIGYLYEFK